MIAIAGTCFLLLCDNTIYCAVTHLGLSRKVSHKILKWVEKKIPTKLESELKKFQVSWISKCQVTPRSNSHVHYLLVVRSCKHKEIFNYYWHGKLKLNWVWGGFLLGFSTGFTQKNLVGFWVLPGRMNPDLWSAIMMKLNQHTLYSW